MKVTYLPLPILLSVLAPACGGESVSNPSEEESAGAIRTARPGPITTEVGAELTVTAQEVAWPEQPLPSRQVRLDVRYQDTNGHFRGANEIRATIESSVTKPRADGGGLESGGNREYAKLAKATEGGVTVYVGSKALNLSGTDAYGSTLHNVALVLTGGAGGAVITDPVDRSPGGREGPSKRYVVPINVSTLVPFAASDGEDDTKAWKSLPASATGTGNSFVLSTREVARGEGPSRRVLTRLEYSDTSEFFRQRSVIWAKATFEVAEVNRACQAAGDCKTTTVEFSFPLTGTRGANGRTTYSGIGSSGVDLVASFGQSSATIDKATLRFYGPTPTDPQDTDFDRGYTVNPGNTTNVPLPR